MTLRERFLDDLVGPEQRDDGEDDLLEADHSALGLHDDLGWDVQPEYLLSDAQKKEVVGMGDYERALVSILESIAWGNKATDPVLAFIYQVLGREKSLHDIRRMHTFRDVSAKALYFTLCELQGLDPLLRPQRQTMKVDFSPARGMRLGNGDRGDHDVMPPMQEPEDL
jgi:hypothetical protein